MVDPSQDDLVRVVRSIDRVATIAPILNLVKP
jgi:hypothetical protein